MKPLKNLTEANEAFEKSKEALAKATILHYPKPSAETSIAVDASDTAVGGESRTSSDAIRKKHLCFFRKKNMFFSHKKLGLHKKHSKSFFFQNTHLKEITS